MKKLTLLILTLFCVFGCTETNRTENLLAKVNSLKIKNDSLTKILTEKKPEVNYWFDAEYDGEKLIKSGINNPIEFIEKIFVKKLN